MPELPGNPADTNLPPTVQPGTGAPTTDQTKADVARWNRLVNIKPALDDLMAVFTKHPELFVWLKEGESGTMRVD